MYRPIIDEHFKDLFRISTEGKFKINEDDEARIELLSYLNDNVFQNITSSRMGSNKLYDNNTVQSDIDEENIDDEKKNRFKKDPLELEQKKDIAEEFVGVYKTMDEQYKKLN